MSNQAPFPALAPGLFVSPQISRQDIITAAAAGVQTIICKRPDGEEPGQPSFEQIRHWAAEAGIRHVIYQPMLMPQIDAADAAQFAQHLADHPAPALAYCRSGTRSSFLWAMGQAAQGADPRQLVQTAAAAGIDPPKALDEHSETCAGAPASLVEGAGF